MKRILCIIIVIMIVFSLFGCSADREGVAQPNGEDEKVPEPNEITVTDSEGREVTTSSVNGDIVSVSREATSLLIALGAKDRLTGVEDSAKDTELFKRAFPEIEDVAVVTDGDRVLTDKIIEQNPGLVVITKKQTDLVSVFEQAGITCAVVALDTVEDIKNSINLMGALSNTTEKAQKLSSYYSSALSRITVLTMVEQKHTVTVLGGNPLITELVSHISCEITDSGEYVIASRDDAADGVITVPDGIERWDRPSVSLVLGLYWYTHCIYPDLISEAEISQRAINFYSEFYNIDVTSLEVGIDIRENVDK